MKDVISEIKANLVPVFGNKTDAAFDCMSKSYDRGLERGRVYLTDITHRNYEATKRRGLILRSTSMFQFVDKIKEESDELEQSICDNKFESFDPSELADIALVCFAMAEHYGIDLIEEMRNKTEFNEKRP